MEINLFVYQIVFFLIPGLIGSKIYRTLKDTGRSHKIRKNWEDISEVFLFTVFSFLTLDFINLLRNNTSNNRIKSSIELLIKADVKNIQSVLISSIIISIILGIIMSIVVNYNIINKIGSFLRITNQNSENDVWHNFIKKNNEWVYIRDHKERLNYMGYIKKYSDSGEKREIVLADVDVYDYDEVNDKYHVDKLYISRDHYDISIEIPDKEEERKDV